MRYTPTGEQVENILTKALSKIKFTYFREKMGMIENPFHLRKGWSLEKEGATIRILQWKCNSTGSSSAEMRGSGQDFINAADDVESEQYSGILLKHFSR